jgi:branched-chain amino acid transport system substrate-binding protein
MKLKNNFIALLFLYVFIASGQAKEVVKIGVIYPLSGANAEKGEANLEAVKMALSEVPKDSKFEYQLFFEDDQTNPRLTSVAAQKLINVNKIDAVLTIFSGAGNVVNSIAEKNKIIHLATATDPAVGKGDYNFVYNYMSADFGKKWAEIFAQKGFKKISIITLNQQGALTISKAFIKMAPQYGIEVVDQQVFNPGEKDFRSFIGKAQASKPEAYFLCSLAPELDILWKQFRQLEVKGFYTGFLDLAQHPKTMENTWFVNMQKPRGDFQNRYEEKTKKRVTVGVPNAYDQINLLVQAYEASPDHKKPSAHWVAQQINKTGDQFKGVAGDFKFDKELGYFRLEPGVNIIKDGLVETYAVEKVID